MPGLDSYHVALAIISDLADNGRIDLLERLRNIINSTIEDRRKIVEVDDDDKRRVTDITGRVWIMERFL